MLTCTVPEYRDIPTPRGFEIEDGEWRCDPEMYRSFLERVAGGTPPFGCGGDCYVVGTRIEGLIERHKANGEWTDELPDRYPDVESRDEIEALAVFLRACESDHGPSEETARWAGTQQP